MLSVLSKAAPAQPLTLAQVASLATTESTTSVSNVQMAADRVQMRTHASAATTTRRGW